MFFIAEIGINHNGDIKIAKKLIRICKEIGVDAVKFQKRDIYKVYSKKFLNEHRESPFGSTQLDQKKGLEFSYKDYKIIDNYCKKLKIQWFASAWDLNSLKFLDKLKNKYQKIASPMLSSKKFLKEVAKRKKYTFISTGMSNMKMISDAVKIFKKEKCKFELMHCVSVYPCDAELVNLNCINTLKKKFKCKVGYSGHEKGISVSVAAAVLGATSIERHISLDRTMYGSDQSASLEPKGFGSLIEMVKKNQIAMGNGKKTILNQEKPIIKKLRSQLSN